MARSKVAHDHVVLLLNESDFHEPPAWLADNFHIIDGGTHSGGSSRNKLIIFSDGTYLELFNWIKDPVEFKDWANKEPGLIDFALTTLSPGTALENYDAIKAALHADTDSGLGATYDRPRSGGRKRRDGVDIRWETTRPRYHEGSRVPPSLYLPSQRLDVPFFCHDITERSARVQYHDPIMTKHPCGATGISSVRVLVPETHFKEYVTLYRSILGAVETTEIENDNVRRARFPIVTPDDGLKTAYIDVCSISEDSRDEKSDQSQADRDWLRRRGIGIQSLVIAATSYGSTNRVTGSLADGGVGATLQIVH